MFVVRTKLDRALKHYPLGLSTPGELTSAAIRAGADVPPAEILPLLLPEIVEAIREECSGPQVIRRCVRMCSWVGSPSPEEAKAEAEAVAEDDRLALVGALAWQRHLGLPTESRTGASDDSENA